MSPSPEAIAIHSPLAIVADLYSKKQDSDSFFSTVASHFYSVLSRHESSIPRLEDTHDKGKLVRFRCMVQDTGLANEVYVLDINAGGEEDAGRGCCAYSEGAIDGSPILDYESVDYSKLRERQVIYATSVPGETDWHRRSRSSSSGDLADDLSSRLSLTSGTSSYVQPKSLAKKYPFPDQPHTGAVVKIYPTASGAEASLKATEIVEFVGVLDYAQFPPNAVEESTSSDTQQGETIKTLHAIYRLPTRDGQAVKGADTKEEEESWANDRRELIAYLAHSLEGDLLAAEWLLLSLLGKIHARRGALALGQLPINIDLPSSFPSSSISSLCSTLSTLLPLFVSLDFSISSLNSCIYFPKSVDESLHSGCLQLPAGTAVLVDETRMGEGTLKDTGVRNVQALSTVVQEQTLGYVFPFSSFTFETDLRVVVLSKGKSLLPIGCVVPLVPSSTSPSTSTSSPAKLARFRSLLAFQPEEFTIPPSVSEFIQSDFVTNRQAKKVTQEDLVRRMTVARLMGISLGRKELDEGIWEMTRVLDERRKDRL